MKLICLGDSLTFGYGVRASQRWTHLCAQHTGWKIVNEGVSGDTTGGMLARLAARVLPELRSGSADEPFQRIYSARRPSHSSPCPHSPCRLPSRRTVAPSHSGFGRNMVRSRAFHQPPFRLFICIGHKNKCVARCGRKKNVSNCMDFQEKAYFCPPEKQKGGLAQQPFPNKN